MEASRLRYRIAIQARSTTLDAHGQQTDAWSTVATVWAGVEPISGREALQADRAQGEVTHRVVMRYRAGITTANRILFGARVFDIVSPPIDRNERHAEIELLCKEGSTNG